MAAPAWCRTLSTLNFFAESKLPWESKMMSGTQGAKTPPVPYSLSVEVAVMAPMAARQLPHSCAKCLVNLFSSHAWKTLGWALLQCSRFFSSALELATVTLKRVCYIVNFPNGILEVC